MTLLTFMLLWSWLVFPTDNGGDTPSAVNINPVIIPNADAACFKFNGEYFHTIFRTGDLVRSKDLVRWSEPIEVFRHHNEWTKVPPRTRMAGTDLRYINGVFHYNYRIMPTPDMGHAISRAGPLGPYHDAKTDRPFRVAGLGPHLFKDDDGRCYYYTTHISRYRSEGRDYTLAGQGNEIWGQTMKDPWTLNGEDVFMLRTTPNTFEEVDSHVMENPWVIKYRGQYYMFYNVAHTGFGNYAISVAQADGPMMFDDSKKYADPLMERTLYGGAPEDGRTILHPGQPSVLKGPNGFTWWMTYFAQYPRTRKNTAVDRVFFFDRLCYMDGPTDPYSAGYHPAPALPTVLDVFDESESLAPHWLQRKGVWQVADGVYRQSSRPGTGQTLLQSQRSAQYLFEANVRILEGARAGVTVWFKDDANYLAVLLDAKAEIWVSRQVEDGAVTERKHRLSPEFLFDAFHQIRVERNGTNIKVWLDEEIADPALHDRTIEFSVSALPGLLTEEAIAEFDGVLYTVGWDEYDDLITGWSDSRSGTSAKGSWRTDSKGISVERESGETCSFKGEFLDQYEIAAQVFPARDGKAGLYAVYTDEQNYLRALLEPSIEMLTVECERDAQDMEVLRVPLPRRWLVSKSGSTWSSTEIDPGTGWEYPAFNDSGWSQRYGASDSVSVDAAQTEAQACERWLRCDFNVDRTPPGLLRFWIKNEGKLEIYLNGILARTVTEDSESYRSHELMDSARLSLRPGRNTMAIHLLSTSRSGFVDAGLYVPKIPESTASTGRHLRAVKRSDRVVLFVDGQEVLTVPGSWPRSQVGLSAVDASARWNGITLFRLGSKYGVSEPEQVFGDDFDDNLLDLRWRRLTVHRRHLRLNESAARQQDTVPDIRFREANQQLQIQGAELGPWDISWSGSGLLYDAPISGAAKVSMEFDGFETRAPDSDMLGGGVGLRLWKADNNWIEIRRISDGAQQEIELSWLDYHTGRVLSASEPVAGRKGSFELAVDTDTGVVTASYNEQERWTRTMPDFTIGQYYAMVTAFTKSWDQDGPSEIVANVDNFIIQTQNSLNSGGGP